MRNHAADLVSAAQLLADQCREAELGLSDDASFPHASPEIRAARAAGTILSTASRIQSILFQSAPASFLQHLISQSQLLACIQWLGEFQVLAYIPPSGDCSVPIKDLADLADVPKAQLSRVVRITAMSGFLKEPQLGDIAHTDLSAAFTTKPAHLDGAMFLGETLLPSALQMATATRKATPTSPTDSAEGSVRDTAQCGQRGYIHGWENAHKEHQAFQVTLGHGKRLQRQWPAYLAYVGDSDEGAAELLGQLDWAGLGSATVVDVGGPPLKAKCVVLALAERYRSLRFVVQMEEPPTSQSLLSQAKCVDFEIAGRIEVRRRASGTLQTIQDAAVYMVRLPTAGTSTLLFPIRNRILAELRAHLGVLQANRSALLILTPRFLPEPGAIDAQVEKMARLRDLSLMQLANDGDVEMQEVMDLVDSVGDRNGRLVVVKKLLSRNSAMVALGIRYQSHSSGV